MVKNFIIYFSIGIIIAILLNICYFSGQYLKPDSYFVQYTLGQPIKTTGPMSQTECNDLLNTSIGVIAPAEKQKLDTDTSKLHVFCVP
jgi:hypothetical protein